LLIINKSVSDRNTIWANLSGYDWQKRKLDPAIMNVKGGTELLPHLVQVY